MQSTMAVPPRATTPEKEHEDAGADGEDEFTFPTPPPQLLGVGTGGARGRDFLTYLAPPCAASASSSPPVWLLSSSSPIRRSFSAADCAASPWRDRVLLARHRRGLNGGCSPAIRDYAARAGDYEGEEEEEEEERMDSLWEDLNDDDAAARGEDLIFGRSIDVPRRRSVAANAAEAVKRLGKDKDKDQLSGGGSSAVLGTSRSSRQRPPGLVAMMRTLRKMFVAQKGKSRVHRDEQSTASVSVSASAYSFSRKR